MYADYDQLYSSGTRGNDVERVYNHQAQVEAICYSDNKPLVQKQKFQAMVMTTIKGQGHPKVNLKVGNEDIDQLRASTD